MIEVLTIPISKDRLAKLSSVERALFVRFGYISNQLSLLQKLLTFSTNEQPSLSLEGVCAGAQTQMPLRLFVGAVAESWKLVSEKIVKSPLRNSYFDILDEGGKKALQMLEEQFRESAFLVAVRNNYGFHLVESDKEIEKAFQTLRLDSGLDDYWLLYASHHGFNSLFHISDLIFIQGIANLAKQSDLNLAQEKLMQEVSQASIRLIEFSRSWIAAIWKKHFGAEIQATKVTQITDAPHVDDVRLPFFVDVSSRP